MLRRKPVGGYADEGPDTGEVRVPPGKTDGLVGRHLGKLLGNIVGYRT